MRHWPKTKASILRCLLRQPPATQPLSIKLVGTMSTPMLFGARVTRNPKPVRMTMLKAAFWYRKAAEQGYAKAQYDLGGFYLFGHGLPVDYAQGIMWLRKAAEQGHPSAQTDLAHFYLTGKYVPRRLCSGDVLVSEGGRTRKSRWAIRARNNVRGWAWRPAKLHRSIFLDEPCGCKSRFSRCI